MLPPDCPRQSAAVKTGVSKCRSQWQRLQQKKAPYPTSQVDRAVPSARRSVAKAACSMFKCRESRVDLSSRDGTRDPPERTPVRFPCSQPACLPRKCGMAGQMNARPKTPETPCRGSRVGCVLVKVPAGGTPASTTKTPCPIFSDRAF